MSNNRRSTSTIEPDAATPTPLTDPFDGVRLTTPLMKLAQQLLGPFLAHKPECTAEACACGLRSAVEDLQRRELLVTRYGAE